MTSTFNDEHDQLLEKYENDNRYDELVCDYDRLQDDYQELQDDYDKLKKKHDRLKRDYESLEEYFDKVMDLKNKGIRNLHTRIHKLVIKAAELV